MVFTLDLCESAQDCLDYQPIQFLKTTPTETETIEDAGCDTCVHHKNNRCEVYLK